MFNCINGVNDPGNEGCILADYMGLGKTLQTLTLLHSCLKMKKGNQKFSKAIVVSPLSLVNVWESELNRWFGDKIIPVVASGDRKTIDDRIHSFAKDQYRLLFLSYESFIKNSKLLNDSCSILVLD